MSQFRGHLLLALAVLVGSAIPFVPTGEMVSGASAVAAHSRLNIPLIFVITWVCSTLGDVVFMVEVRLGARRLRPWLARHKINTAVQKAEAAVLRNVFMAVFTGRLVPGGRTPVILALGLARYDLRRFAAYDAVACAVWAGVYASLGAAGGRIAGHPVVAMLIAVAFAVSLGVGVQQLRRLWRWHHDRSEPGAEDRSSPQVAGTDRRQ